MVDDQPATKYLVGVALSSARRVPGRVRRDWKSDCRWGGKPRPEHRNRRYSGHLIDRGDRRPIAHACRAPIRALEDELTSSPVKLARGERYVGGMGVVACQALIGAAVLLAWEWLADKGSIGKATFSTPSGIWSALRGWAVDGTLWTNAWSTIQVLMIGWAIGVALGTIIGLAAPSRNVWDFIEPFLVFLNAVPRLLLLPLFVVWLGFGVLPKILLVISVIVVIVALAVASGIHEVDQAYLDNVRILGRRRGLLIPDLYGPSVVLWVLASSRTTVGYALQAAVAAEFIGSNVGLGALVVQGQGYLD